MSSEAKWPFIVNLSNGIIGVSVLAMPFCLKQSGILLGAIMLLGSNLLTRFSCHLLLKSAQLSRRRTYEAVAYNAFGPTGKLTIELLCIMFLVSTLVAFFVVIGDLGPDVVGRWLPDNPNPGSIRAGVMILIALTVVLPLSLLKNLESLSHVSGLAIIFYALFVVHMGLSSTPRLLQGSWRNEVVYWDLKGGLQSLPIFSLALSCQTTLFALIESMVDLNVKQMDSIVAGAVNLCSGVYAFVGFFGYVAFSNRPMTGDVLVLFDSSSFVTHCIKIGFLLSVAVSFPLMIYPCRAAIYSLLFKPELGGSGREHGDVVIAYLPTIPFRCITVVLIALTLTIAILVPHVEFILGLTGSLIGSLICFILPGVIIERIAWSEQHHFARLLGKICLVMGVIILVTGTMSTIRDAGHKPNPLEIAQSGFIETPPPTAEKPVVGKQVDNGDGHYENSEEDQQKRVNDQVGRKNTAHAIPPPPTERVKKYGKQDSNGNGQAKEILQQLKANQKEQKQLLAEHKKLVEDFKKVHQDHQRQPEAQKDVASNEIDEKPIAAKTKSALKTPAPQPQAQQVVNEQPAVARINEQQRSERVGVKNPVEQAVGQEKPANSDSVANKNEVAAGNNEQAVHQAQTGERTDAKKEVPRRVDVLPLGNAPKNSDRVEKPASAVAKDSNLPSNRQPDVQKENNAADVDNAVDRDQKMDRNNHPAEIEAPPAKPMDGDKPGEQHIVPEEPKHEEQAQPVADAKPVQNVGHAADAA